MPELAYQGLLLIGDPHLEGRVPGFRKDEYPRVVLEKLGWCLRYAREHSLLPAILGDLFHLPRDNPNWMLGELMALLDPPVLGIYGNHDCHENQMADDDTFSVLVKAGRVRPLGPDSVWSGCMNGRDVIVGGTAWGGWLPKQYVPSPNGNPDGHLVFWLAHHDVKVPGYEEQGRFSPHEIPGIDVVINGHIHRHLDNVQVGRTLWITPGNISRRSRSDATRQHVPAVLRIDVTPAGWQAQPVEVPHKPFEEVFHEEIVEQAQQITESAFVAGLAELQARRTATGAGLMGFLEKNASQFDEAVAAEIMNLANEVTHHGEEDRAAGNSRRPGADDRAVDESVSGAEHAEDPVRDESQQRQEATGESAEGGRGEV